jgi:RNA polymerase sigma factor (sigma-70 family)
MDIESFYKTNFNTFVKRMNRRAGSKEAAEDVVQTAFLRALQYQDSYDPKFPLENWFNRILNNSLRHYKNVERGNASEEFNEEHFDGTDCPGYSKQLVRQIRDMIDTYEGAHLEVLTLYFDHQYRPRDICKVVDLRYKNVETILQRFKTNVKETCGVEL